MHQHVIIPHRLDPPTHRLIAPRRFANAQHRLPRLRITAHPTNHSRAWPRRNTSRQTTLLPSSSYSEHHAPSPAVLVGKKKKSPTPLGAENIRGSITLPPLPYIEWAQRPWRIYPAPTAPAQSEHISSVGSSSAGKSSEQLVEIGPITTGVAETEAETKRAGWHAAGKGEGSPPGGSD